MNRQGIRRIENIEKIKNSVKKITKEGKEIDYQKFIALFSLELNVARRTVMEYVDLLITSGDFINKNGIIVWNGN